MLELYKNPDESSGDHATRINELAARNVNNLESGGFGATIALISRTRSAIKYK